MYKHTSPSNKSYIGITSKNPEERWGHNGIQYRKQPFYRAIKKYGWDNIKHEVIKDGLNFEEADTLEKSLILKFNSYDPNFGYNIQLGGHNGQVHSAASRKKMSEAAKGRKLSFTEEHKFKISESKKGKCSEKLLSSALKNLDKANNFSRDAEYRKKMSEAKKGKPGRVWTEEQKRKHSEIMKKVYSA